MNSFEYVIPENFTVKEADELKRECSDAIKKDRKILYLILKIVNL